MKFDLTHGEYLVEEDDNSWEIGWLGFRLPGRLAVGLFGDAVELRVRNFRSPAFELQTGWRTLPEPFDSKQSDPNNEIAQKLSTEGESLE